MKKAVVFIWLLAAVGFLAGFLAVFFAFRAPLPQADVVLINDALMTLQQGHGEDAALSTAFLEARLTDAFDAMDAARRSRDRVLQLVLYFLLAALAVAAIAVYRYCEGHILAPFRKLQTFAQRIASGNFNAPLEMDRGNHFGAFTEKTAF